MILAKPFKILIMKKLFTLVFLLSTVHFIKAQNFQFDSVGYMELQIGKMIEKGEVWIVRTGEGNAVKDYYPVNLPDEYKISNQDVVITAAIGRIPSNIRMAGTPIELKSIRKLYKTKPHDTGTSTKDQIKTKAAEFDSVGFVKNGNGVIIKIGDVFLIEQTEDNKNNVVRYVPDYLPQDFKIEGLHITFSGVIGQPDPNIRMMGKPLKIKELMAVEDKKIDVSQVQPGMKDIYPVDSVDYLNASKGTIKKMSGSDDTFIIELEGGTRKYIPFVLPQEFRKENMVVVVSGIIGKIPANVRLAGTPLDIKTIEQVNK